MCINTHHTFHLYAMFVRTPVTSPLSVSLTVSDYLSFLVGSVVSIATLLPSVSGKGLVLPFWILLGHCGRDWDCKNGCKLDPLKNCLTEGKVGLPLEEDSKLEIWKQKSFEYT